MSEPTVPSSTVSSAIAGTAIAIGLRDVTKQYPGSDRPAVQQLSMDIPAGELVVFVGPSGCGKTTTLRMINRLDDATSGTITIDGVDVRDRSPEELRRGIGYVIQQVGLFPHRSIRDNIATVPRLLGWNSDRIAARVDELVELVDLDPGLLGRYPAALSGGQQQRVGVARALAADPPILLMDEPYSAVDPVVRGHLQDELVALHQRLGTTIVLVTHDIDEALKVADRIAVFETGGRLAQYATADDLLRSPADPFVERFLGGERTLRRLALVPLTSVTWRAAESATEPTADPVATIDARATAREALDLLVASGRDRVTIVDDGTVVGAVGLAELTAVIER